MGSNTAFLLFHEHPGQNVRKVDVRDARNRHMAHTRDTIASYVIDTSCFAPLVFSKLHVFNIWKNTYLL